MLTKSNLLIPQEGTKNRLDEYCLELLTAHQVAQGCANTLILQPSFSNSLLVTLPEDQALASQHASTYKKGQGFGFASSILLGLKSMSSTNIALLEALKSTAKTLDDTSTGTANYKQTLIDFRADLSAIIDGSTNDNPNSGSVLLQMQEMQTALKNLAAEIQNDATRLSTAVKEVKNGDVIAKIQAEQNALQNQLADVNNQLAKGALTTIPSAISFGFSLASKFIKGVSTGAIGGAALSIVGEAQKIKQFNEQTNALQKKQDDLANQISALASQITEDKLEVMTLTLVGAQIQVFCKNINAIVALMDSIIEILVNWKEDLEVLSDYSAPPEKDFFTNQVHAGLGFWKDLSQRVTRYSSLL